MLEQLTLWQQQPAMAPLRHGTLREHLQQLEPLADRLPVWRDELYLELHRGCATSRPDQKRHNRTLERLLREAELARALLQPLDLPTSPAAEDPRPAGTETSARARADGERRRRERAAAAPVDWRPLLFQQFHDILPGTSIPEVFEQAEPTWRAARRQARRQRDRALLTGIGAPPALHEARLNAGEAWWVAQLQPLAAVHRCRRLPAGTWHLASGPHAGALLTGQPAPEGGVWLQLPIEAGVSALALRRSATAPDADADALAIEHPVTLTAEGEQRWRVGNGLVSARCGPGGLEQLWDAAGRPLLGAPLRWRRWRDQGEFWDAWDIAADHRDHPLDWNWEPGPAVHADGPLCGELVWRGRCGDSPLRLSLRLLAGSPALELALSVDWRQRHELLQLEIPLATPQPRWAADCSGGILERPAQPRTPREQARWEVTTLSWIAAPELAVLLDGPQGVSASPERLTVSLLRAPTWPDPGADNGWQRQRLALMPAPQGWRAAGVPEQARRLREPLWLHPARSRASRPSGDVWPGFPALGDDLRLVGLRPAEPLEDSQPEASEASPTDGGHRTRALLLTVQNEGPCRRWLTLPAPWRVLQRVDGLGQPLPEGDGADRRMIRPWQLGCWRIERADAAVPPA